MFSLKTTVGWLLALNSTFLVQGATAYNAVGGDMSPVEPERFLAQWNACGIENCFKCTAYTDFTAKCDVCSGLRVPYVDSNGFAQCGATGWLIFFAIVLPILILLCCIACCVACFMGWCTCLSSMFGGNKNNNQQPAQVIVVPQQQAQQPPVAYVAPQPQQPPVYA